MSQYQQNPQQPQQPQQPYGYGTPQPPAPKPKMSRGKKIGIGFGIFFALIVVGAVASGGEDTADGEKDQVAAEQPKDQAPAAKDDKPAEEKPKDEPEPEAPAEKKSQAEEFKAFIAKNGTPQEQDAAKHVVKVQGAGEQNDILDSAEIHTDYTGGIVGPHTGDGKLLASAFADWRDSKNGLVTVYDSAGEILSNGNF
ncbi:hypothetical protein LHJ74_14645 [Streptomyces sp. N2-109]|uniref:Uncharacterized protein n=1 Tax=Streptomyces gossypii TaxID=2883101 RepID=A0ABT2JTB3_9ACTN|nr:hypothetical protein [Streptomyces gossypii]MCT2591132.1 hypothetical protein [Streptomyces gossypii]